jgi:hypothetical protein
MLNSVFAVVLVATASVPAATAQIQNPIQAAKDAYKKAKEQQQQNKKAQQPTPQGQATEPTNAPAQSNPAASALPAEDGDCCSPAALKKIAASVGFVDIVGIKLGMTPAQAVAGVRAYNPNLKIETLTTRLEHPSGPPGNFVRVPHTVNAYTANNRQDLGPVEWIAMQFTLPPGPPLLAKVQRYSGFVASQPVINATLLQSLRKKYGQDNYAGGGSMGWVYDSNGKLLTRVSNVQGVCPGDGLATGVPGGGSGPHPPPGETGVGVDLSNTDDSRQVVPEAGPDCMPLVWVVARGVGEDYAPNSQQSSMTVTMESGALMSMSRKATHAWLQAEENAKAKKQEDDAKARTGPSL